MPSASRVEKHFFAVIPMAMPSSLLNGYADNGSIKNILRILENSNILLPQLIFGGCYEEDFISFNGCTFAGSIFNC